jgi:hypothetical protein
MVAVTTETTGQGQNIELILYKDNKDEQYLILNLQVDVKEP